MLIKCWVWTVLTCWLYKLDLKTYHHITCTVHCRQFNICVHIRKVLWNFCFVKYKFVTAVFCSSFQVLQFICLKFDTIFLEEQNARTHNNSCSISLYFYNYFSPTLLQLNFPDHTPYNQTHSQLLFKANSHITSCGSYHYEWPEAKNLKNTWFWHLIWCLTLFLLMVVFY